MKVPECQIQETGLNVRIYLITDAIVLTVDTRLCLATKILLKGGATHQMWVGLVTFARTT